MNQCCVLHKEVISPSLINTCFLSPAKNLVSEGGRLLLIFIIYYFDLQKYKQCKSDLSLDFDLFIGPCPSSLHLVHIGNSQVI